MVVGRHLADPLANADVARVAYLMQETTAMPCVRYALLDGVRHGVTEQIASLVREGFHHVIVVPWMICDSELSQFLDAEIAHAARLHNVCVTLAAPSLTHPALINLLVSNQYAALSLNDIQFPVGTNDELKAAGEATPSIGSLRDEITPEDEIELQELERRINALLPFEYQGRYESVSPQSMGTAALKTDCEGRVAWDQIWTSFCDLALAGGPPHRGTLLEAVTASDALAEPEKYQAVVAEIERAIRMVTSLPVVTSKTPGWVGVRCQSEEMAVWLMRAIIVENIMVRREGGVLYLPAGPHFTLKREIKNVVTAIAKTVHYWTAHLVARGHAV